MCFLVWVLICARGRPSCWSKTYLAVIQVGEPSDLASGSEAAKMLYKSRGYTDVRPYDSGPFLSWPDKWSDAVTRLQRQFSPADSGRFEDAIPNIPAQGYILFHHLSHRTGARDVAVLRLPITRSLRPREHCCGYQRAHVRQQA